MSERAPPPPPVDLPKASPKRRRYLFIGLGVLAPVVALLVIAGLLLQVMGWTTFRQASGSMRPSLQLDERFFVDRRAYRDERRPDYGDIITFWIPTEVMRVAGPDVTFVKRVIGLPGDRVEVAAGGVSVNGRPLPQEPLGEVDDGRPGRTGKAQRLREQAPNGVSYDIMRYQPVRNPDAAASGSYVVPRGHYFVIGDDSLDSRHWVLAGGWYLPLGNITGRATYIYWAALDRIGTALK
jgi:signal peptidase I